jgi:hypothetical protein
MKVSKRRCHFCKRWYQPHPRTAHHQRACADPACQEKRKAENNLRWQGQNKGYDKTRGAKKRVWARQYPNYWQHYRVKNLAYREKDNRRRVLARRKTSVSANQAMIRKISVEKLQGIRGKALELSANQAVIKPAMTGIFELAGYLLWKELSAKQDAIANNTPGERQYEYASGNMGGDKAIESG